MSFCRRTKSSTRAGRKENFPVFSWFHTDRLSEYMTRHNNKNKPKDLGFDMKNLLGEAARYFN